jgi:hypothetical protein
VRVGGGLRAAEGRGGKGTAWVSGCSLLAHSSEGAPGWGLHTLMRAYMRASQCAILRGTTRGVGRREEWMGSAGGLYFSA